MIDEIGLLLGIPLTLYLAIIFILTGLVGIIIKLVKNRNSSTTAPPFTFSTISETVKSSPLPYVIFSIGLVSLTVWLILERVWNPLKKLDSKISIILGNDALNCKRSNQESELCDPSLEKDDCERKGVCKYTEELKKCESIYTVIAEHNSSEYTYIFSVLLNDIAYKSGEKKTIIKRTSPNGSLNPHIYFDKLTNNLWIEFTINCDESSTGTDNSCSLYSPSNHLSNLNKYQIEINNISLQIWYTIAVRYSISDRQIRVLITSPGPEDYVSYMAPLPIDTNTTNDCKEYGECSEYLQNCKNVDNNDLTCYPKKIVEENESGDLNKCTAKYCWVKKETITNGLPEKPTLEIGTDGGFDGMLRNFIIFDEALTLDQIKNVSVNLRNAYMKPDLGFMKIR